MVNQKLTSHIDHAIHAAAHTQMYLIHKWWARKPHNVVSEYIRYYSKVNEIVLDPFCGSGVTPLEAIKLGRKAVAIDFNPMAIFLSRMCGINIDTRLIKLEFDRIEQAIKKELTLLYKTKCTRCKNDNDIICSIWHIDSEIPHTIRYECKTCKKKIHKKLDEEDLKNIKNINKKKIICWYPKIKLAYESGNEFKEGTHYKKFDDVSSLFTHRNLFALSILYDKINSIAKNDVRNIFQLAFTSMVHLASKMTPDRPTRPYSSFWPVHRYWIPENFMESNVWSLFESVVLGKQGIIVGKEDSNRQISSFKEAKNFKDLQSKANALILNETALDMTSLPSNSIDYVFTDPPYGGSVQYFELSTLWASWLNKKNNFNLDYSGEVTINKNQNKDFDFYHNMLRSAFKEIFRVLKPQKYLTVTFHNTDIRIYNSILKAVVRVGFDLEKVVYQPPARASAKSLLQPFGSAIGDYYLRFKKPLSITTKLNDEEIEKDRYEKIIVESIKKIIAERGEPTAYSYLINSYSAIYEELKKRGYLFTASQGIDDILKKYKNQIFTIVEKKDERGKVKAKLWWFKDPSSIAFLERVPLSERVERAIINVLTRNYQITFDDIMQEIFIKFPDSLTPETSDVVTVLEAYAEKVKGGKWRLRASVRHRENEHDNFVENICVLGEKCGFEVYGDTTKRRTKLTFNFPKRNIERIQEIDALWYKDGKIQYAFEVENSTGITEAIIRGANITYPVKRIIIIPEERENLLVKKVKEPAIEDRIIEDGWLFIRYGDFENFFANNKRKRKLVPKELEKLHKPPKSAQVKKIDDFMDK